ncbi:MAG: TolB family protein, partial [Mycobacteriales bacterium]
MTAPLLPLEHFYDNPQRAMARISPDGQQLAFLAPEEGQLNVWVRPLAGGEERAVTHDHTRGIVQYAWTRDSAGILYLQDRGGDENHHLYLALLAAPGEEARDLTPFDGVKVFLLDTPPGDPGGALVMLNQRDPGLFDVARVDLATGELKVLVENPGRVGGWIPDPDGRIVAAYAQLPGGDYEHLAVGADGELRQVATYATVDGGEPLGAGPGGTSVWVCSARGTDCARLALLDLATGEERTADSDPASDLETVWSAPVSGQPYAAVYRRERLVLHPLDPAVAPVLEA